MRGLNVVIRRAKRKRKLKRQFTDKGEEPPDPVTLTVLAVSGAVIGAAGTAFGAISSYQNAQQSAAMSESNALAAERDAAFARDQARFNETLSRQRANRVRGSQRAAVGASGLDFSGSPLDLLEETAVQSEIEALNIRRQGEFTAGGSEFQAAGSRLQANAFRRQGRSQLTSGLLASGGQLVGGAATAGANYKVMTGAY